MKEYTGYKIINIKGKQMVIIPNVYNFEKRIKRLEFYLKFLFKILDLIEKGLFAISVGVIGYYILDFIIK